MSDGFPYSYPPQTFQPAQPQTQQHYQPAETQPKLMCVECNEEIEEGEECFNFLYGKAGRGERSGRRMVVASKDIPNGECNLHFACLPYFIFNSLPDVAGELYTIDMEMREPEDKFCQVCATRLDPTDDDC